MSFLSPLFLVGAFAAAIPIVLHLLKREPEARVRFSAVKLLRSAPVEHTSRRHLRELLLLALRVAALLLLAAAFARPFFAGEDFAGSGAATIVALDTSTSLSAPGAFARARELARQAVERAPAGAPVGVVAFADTAEVVARPSRDRGAAAAAIAAAEAGFGSTRYRGAIEAAAELLDRRPGTIVIVTDLQEHGWRESDRLGIPSSVRIEVVDVGEPPPNLAVTSVREAGGRVVATVRNTAPERREARVRLLIGGAPAGEAVQPIDSGGSAEIALPLPEPPAGTAAAVSVADEEGVQGDNTRYLVLGAGRIALLAVTNTGDVPREAFFLHHALITAGTRGGGYRLDGVAASALGGWDETRLERYAAVVLMSTRGLERRGRDLLSAFAAGGGGILVIAGPDVDGEIASDTFGGVFTLAAPGPAAEPPDRRLAPVDMRHPIFRPFGAGASSLGLVRFRRIVPIEAPSCQTLARFTTGEPALVECADRLLVLASDADSTWNDFPVHATFVPFVHETIAYVAARRAPAADYLVADVPPDVAPVPGITAVANPADPAAPRLAAVNVDPVESETGRMSSDAFLNTVARLNEAAPEPAAAVPVEARRQEDRQRLWQYILVLMLTMLALESVVGTRTA